MTRTALIPALASAALALAALPASAQGAEQSEPMHSYADMAPVEGTSATLTRLEHGVAAQADTTGLTPGDAVTLLWVIFNEPAACSDGACGADDVFNIADGAIVPNPDGSPPVNDEGIEAAAISVLLADGRVVDEGGTAAFRAHLPIGDTTQAVLGPGLIDPDKAEIHLVVRTHDQAQPGMAREMLNTMNGGCAPDWPNEPCKNVQFTTFKAPGTT
jgi:hypothetical protein